MSINPPGFLVHRPTGFHLLSPQVRQCCLQFTNVVSHVVHADVGDADDEVGGVQFYSYGVGVCVGVAFTISHSAVTCWVCSPSPVLQSNTRVQQKLGVVALPYTSTFTLSNTAVTCWVCFPSPVLMSSITVKQKLGVVALPYTLMFMLLLLLLIGLLVLVLVSMYDII